MTRYTFTGNLNHALQQARLKTFNDDGRLKQGDQIAHTIHKALEASRISIVVFSKDFGYSSWCLEEVVKVLCCHKKNKQRVIPVFYDVEPSVVRHQTGNFGKSLDEHEKRFKDKVREWRSALYEASSFTGYHFGSGGEYEYEVIEHIVEDVTRLLQPRHDIFLSFCGKDSRFSFTDFLYNSLRQSGFKIFINDIDEKHISESTIHAIKKSRLSIIVFSKNYAHSSSCLNELLTILECVKNKNQLVWPIFYNVEPSDLRHQRNSYGEAMTQHEKLLGENSPKLQNWRSALFQVANVKGWHLKIGYEYQLIEKIVEMATQI